MVTVFTSHWQQGFDARKAGVAFTDAPCYRGTDTPRVCWQNGWKWADKQLRKRHQLRERRQLKE